MQFGLIKQISNFNIFIRRIIMKTKRTVAIFILSILFVTLIGCSGTINDIIDVVQENEIDTEQFNETQVPETRGGSRNPPILTVNLSDSTNTKSEILNHINTSTISNNESSYYNLHSTLKISEIEKFYNLDNFNIEGFELNQVVIMGGVFGFYYAPSRFPMEDYIFDYDTGVHLQVIRHEFIEKDNPATIERLIGVFGSDGKVILDGDLFYVDTIYNYNMIVGLLKETYFFMYVPKSIPFDSLPEIARQLVNTAELVDVQHELDVMRQSRD